MKIPELVHRALLSAGLNAAEWKRIRAAFEASSIPHDDIDQLRLKLDESSQKLDEEIGLLAAHRALLAEKELLIDAREKALAGRERSMDFRISTSAEEIPNTPYELHNWWWRTMWARLNPRSSSDLAEKLNMPKMTVWKGCRKAGIQLRKKPQGEPGHAQ